MIIKIYISAFLLLFSFLAFSQVETIVLNNYSFELKKDKISNEDGEDIKIINLYRNGSSKLLSHILKESIGDCNSESLEIGDYTVTGSTITFYSFWCTRGDAPVSPYGARIQVYKADNNGQMILDSSQVYIEAGSAGWIPGLEFLFKKPTTNKEKEEFKTYIDEIESSYDATFVFGDDANELIKKVKEQLHKEITSTTKDWNDENTFGIRL